MPDFNMKPTLDQTQTKMQHTLPGGVTMDRTQFGSKRTDAKMAPMAGFDLTSDALGQYTQAGAGNYTGYTGFMGGATKGDPFAQYLLTASTPFGGGAFADFGKSGDDMAAFMKGANTGQYSDVQGAFPTQYVGMMGGASGVNDRGANIASAWDNYMYDLGYLPDGSQVPSYGGDWNTSGQVAQKPDLPAAGPVGGSMSSVLAPPSEGPLGPGPTALSQPATQSQPALSAATPASVAAPVGSPGIVGYEADILNPAKAQSGYAIERAADGSESVVDWSKQAPPNVTPTSTPPTLSSPATTATPTSSAPSASPVSATSPSASPLGSSTSSSRAVYEPGGAGGYGYYDQALNPNNWFDSEGNIDQRGALNDVVTQTQAAQSKTNETNEQRYKDILGGYQDMYKDQEGYIEGMGAQQRKDINQEFTSKGNEAYQQLVGSGLSGTTITPSVMAGFERQRADAQTNLADTLNRERSDILGQYGTNALDFMERRTDEGPDTGMITDLLTGLASSQEVTSIPQATATKVNMPSSAYSDWTSGTGGVSGSSGSGSSGSSKLGSYSPSGGSGGASGGGSSGGMSSTLSSGGSSSSGGSGTLSSGSGVHYDSRTNSYVDTNNTPLTNLSPDYERVVNDMLSQATPAGQQTKQWNDLSDSQRQEVFKSMADNPELLKNIDARATGDGSWMDPLTDAAKDLMMDYGDTQTSLIDQAAQWLGDFLGSGSYKDNLDRSGDPAARTAYLATVSQKKRDEYGLS